MVKVELYISKTCPHCPKAKEIVADVLSHVEPGKIELEIIDIHTEEGLKRAKSSQVTGVPTLVVDGEFMSSGFEGWKVAKMIDLKLNPKPSFWQKIFGR